MTDRPIECAVCGLTPFDLPEFVDPEHVFEVDDNGVTHCWACAGNPTRCTCYDPESMEYGPNYPCPRCQVLETTASKET